MKLVIITTGNDDASQVYVKKKIQKGEELGINVVHEHIEMDLWGYEHIDLGEHLRAAITMYNQDDRYHGILLQLPLDESLKKDTQMYLDMIDPKKDVDCLTTYNQGKIMLGDNSYLPCTTQAVLDMIIKNAGDLNGKIIHVVGRSTLVTKPLIVALINAGASVKTWNSNFDKWDICSDVRNDLEHGDVHFISGIGQTNYFDTKWIEYTTRTFDEDFKDRFFLYDIGMNRDENGKLCGDIERNQDVAFQSIVPGTKEIKSIGNFTVEHVFNNLKKLNS